MLKKIRGEAARFSTTEPGRIPETELGDCLGVEATPCKIVECYLPFRISQPTFEPGGCRLDSLKEAAALFLALHFLRCGARYFHAVGVCQSFDRFRKTQVFCFHDEANRIAVLAAAKAMVEAFFLIYRKGRGLLLVERTKSGVLSPTPLK